MDATFVDPRPLEHTAEAVNWNNSWRRRIPSVQAADTDLA